MKERQEWDLINHADFGLLGQAEPWMRVRSRTGRPTPDDLDELLARVWKKPGFFLAHPRAIAAFGRECTRRGVPPPTVNLFGSPFLTWRGVPFVAITLLAGLQTISPSYYEASAIDGATPWQQFRHVTLPLLTPIIAVVMTFSVLFTFTDFQLIYVLTRGGPLNATHLMATLAFQRGIPGGSLGEGAALATLMVPFLLAAVMFSYFGLQRRAWQQGGDK